RSEGVSADHPECAGARESSLPAGTRDCAGDSGGGRGVGWKWAGGGALFRDRSAGARDGGGGVRGKNGGPGDEHRGCDSGEAGSVSSCSPRGGCEDFFIVSFSKATPVNDRHLAVKHDWPGVGV